MNGSDEPVYGLFICVVFIQGAAPRTAEEWLRNRGPVDPWPLTTISILPPGRWTASVDDVGTVLGGRVGAEVAFTDRAGRNWIRRATGALEELDRPPLESLGGMSIVGPYDLVSPAPVD